jgi:hypothetical protein
VPAPVILQHTEHAHRKEHRGERGAGGSEERELHEPDHSNYHDNASADAEETGEDSGDQAERDKQETHCGLLVLE